MKTEDLLQELSVLMYRDPLSRVRTEADYPNLANRLHVAILLLDCDTEIGMSGMAGYVSGKSGRHLAKATEALRLIGATEWAGILQKIQESLARHQVSWEHLQGDPKWSAQVDAVDQFKQELATLAPEYSLFNTDPDSEDAYGALCQYVEQRMSEFGQELYRRKK